MSRRIRCVSLLARFEVPTNRMREELIRRDFGAVLRGLVADVPTGLEKSWDEAIPKLLRIAAQSPGAAQEILNSFPPVVVVAVTRWLDLELPRINAEADARINGRHTLSRCELNLALVPFTARCSAEKQYGRECWCGCWVIDGIPTCPFCGDPAPSRRPTAVWIRRPCNEDQLDPILEKRQDLENAIEQARLEGARIPFGSDPDKYIADIESVEYGRDEASDEFAE